jgi:hypothetical protein
MKLINARGKIQMSMVLFELAIESKTITQMSWLFCIMCKKRVGVHKQDEVQIMHHAQNVMETYIMH